MAKLFLTNEEHDNIVGREKFFGYIQDLITRDINMYLQMDVLKRLNVDTENKEFSLSEDRKSIEVRDIKRDTEKKIILDSNGKV